MPNGGTPIHMVLRPQKGRHIIYCRGAVLKVFSKEEWDKSKSQGEPIIVLEKQEAQVIERFLRYWLTDEREGPIYRHAGIEVEYDY